MLSPTCAGRLWLSVAVSVALLAGLCAGCSRDRQAAGPSTVASPAARPGATRELSPEESAKVVGDTLRALRGIAEYGRSHPESGLLLSPASSSRPAPGPLWGAFPVRTSVAASSVTLAAAGAGPIISGGMICYCPEDAAGRLSNETGLAIRGHIVYIILEPSEIAAFGRGDRPHYLPEAHIERLRAMVDHGLVPQLALEPGLTPDAGGVSMFQTHREVVHDLAVTLGTLGPCYMRIASELNLADSPYYVPAHYPPQGGEARRAGPEARSPLEELRASFGVVHDEFKTNAPEITLTFSIAIPSEADAEARDHSVALARRYLPYVAGSVDMLTGTFYARSPAAVNGLLDYATMVRAAGKPFGIDELGCTDSQTFALVMRAIREGRLGDLRYVNFFDYHVTKPGEDNPWQLKPPDIALLRTAAPLWAR